MGFVCCSGSIKKTHFKLVMIGFEGAGKATIDYQLRILHNMSFVYNCNGSTTFIYKGIVVDLFTLELIDVVQDNTLTIYLKDTDGIILVIDSNDKDKFEKNKEVFYSIIKNFELRNCPILIMANKQDIPTSKSTEEISTEFSLNTIRNRTILLQGVNAKDIRNEYGNEDIKKSFLLITNSLLGKE